MEYTYADYELNTESANCSTTDPDLFFPDTTSYRNMSKAFDVCAMCQIVDKCLEYAILTQEEYGIWGGATPDMRDRMTTPQSKKVHLTNLAKRAKEIKEKNND
jgi:WhiB family redox-sensing transcriptional regulator